MTTIKLAVPIELKIESIFYFMKEHYGINVKMKNKKFQKWNHICIVEGDTINFTDGKITLFFKLTGITTQEIQKTKLLENNTK